MGLLAAAIKAISCTIFMMSFNPVFYMLIEAAAMGVALLLIRPKQAISFAGLATFILANTLYLGATTFLRVNVMTSTAQAVMDNVVTYVFSYNCVAILYTFAVGAAIYGIIKLAEAKERLAKYEGYQKMMEESGASQLSLTDADSKLMKSKKRLSDLS